MSREKQARVSGCFGRVIRWTALSGTCLCVACLALELVASGNKGGTPTLIPQLYP